MGQGQAPLLGPAAVESLLAGLGPIKDEIILIGGQALNLWAEYYMDRSEALRAGAPHTSKDIDFYGDVEHVQRCAADLGAEYTTYGPEHRTPCAGFVTHKGLEIEFVRTPAGVPVGELGDFSLPIRGLRVMHPVHVLESRAANVTELDRTEPLALKQLRTAIVVAREFQNELLERRKFRDVSRLGERIFDRSCDERGLTLYSKHGIDIFEAVLCDPRMPEKFRTLRYPQMRLALLSAREKAK